MPEVPLEETQETIHHHAHESTEKWIMGVALTAAVMAVMAAVTALLAEHHANEAMIEQIQSADSWNYYQAKGIKANVLTTKIELREALGKEVRPEDRAKLAEYGNEQKEIKDKAEGQERASKIHVARHTTLSFGVTMFQVAIAVGAISVLTKKKLFWAVSIAFGLVGAGFLSAGLWGIFTPAVGA
ncbi:MAG: DUF4337 domain-containing protein [Thermoguttaceae bacterium]|jgi:LPS O-antigen subunit length determinant protein (WzzB/FepE family)